MKNILLAGLLGGLTVFLWGFLSWVVLPWHNATMHAIPNEDAVITAMQQTIPSSGVYLFPAMPMSHDDPAQKAYADKCAKGPIGMLFYTREGMDAMRASTFIIGYLLFVFSALIAAALLSMTMDKLPGYGTRVIFVTLLGVFVASEGHLSAWNWVHMQFGYAVVGAADAVIGWLLAGLVIAAFVKPAKKV
jgi:hypothetical protein